MLGRKTRFLNSLLYFTDLALVAAAWLLAYPIRFHLGIIPLYVPHLPAFGAYAWLTLLILLIWSLGLRGGALYRETTVPSLFKELTSAMRAHLVSFLLFVMATFFLTRYRPSRIVIALFLVLSSLGIVMNHVLTRRALIRRHRKGVGLRKTLIVGSGELGRELGKRISRHKELGLEIVGFLSDEEAPPEEVDGWPVLGAPEDVRRIVREHGVGVVFVALPLSMGNRLKKVMEAIGEEMVDLKVVPDLFQYVTLHASVEEFEGLPIISINESPLYGWHSVGKRLFDLFGSGVGLILLSPLLGVIALLVKLGSRGPVLYAQERMGLDGRVFRMLKFRSMRVDAEAKTGAVWAVKDDPRRTRVGAFLRKTSLDELPQLINVVRGEMSLVGPRPERPVFIEKFREGIPKYMLRHKVKAGISGWAQVNGWRGDTELSRRIEYDIYYIENWSFWLDMRILWMTLYKGFVDKNA